jgi:hypothetical protein
MIQAVTTDSVHESPFVLYYGIVEPLPYRYRTQRKINTLIRIKTWRQNNRTF